MRNRRKNLLRNKKHSFECTSLQGILYIIAQSPARVLIHQA